MKNKLKAAAAAVTAFALLGGALPVNFAGVELLRPAVTANAAECCTFDEETKTLTLHGNVDKAEVAQFLYSSRSVKSIVCEVGTVLPEDCSGLFSFEAREEEIYNGWEEVIVVRHFDGED